MEQETKIKREHHYCENCQKDTLSDITYKVFINAVTRKAVGEIKHKVECLKCAEREMGIHTL